MTIPNEYVIKPFRSWIWGSGLDRDLLTFEQPFLLLFGPSPGIEYTVRGGSILSEIGHGIRNRSSSLLFYFTVRWSNRGVWMKYSPCILNRCIACYQLVCEGKRQHVEVSQSEHQVAPLGSTAHQFGNLPSLGCTMTDIRIVWFTLVRCMQMRAENFSYLSRTWAESNSSARDSFSHIPISSPKSRWTAVQGISDHAGFLDWPFRKDR